MWLLECCGRQVKSIELFETGCGCNAIRERFIVKFLEKVRRARWSVRAKKNRVEFIAIAFHSHSVLWSHLGSNQGPTDYESVALTD